MQGWFAESLVSQLPVSIWSRECWGGGTLQKRQVEATRSPKYDSARILLQKSIRMQLNSGRDVRCCHLDRKNACLA